VISVHVLASRSDRSGGADVYTSELVRRLSTRGYDVTLFCHESDDATKRAVKVVEVDRGESNRLPLVWRIAPILQLAAVSKSVRHSKASRPDVVIGMAHQIIWAHARHYGRCPLLYLPHSMIAPVEVATYEWRSNIKKRSAVWLWDRLECSAMNRAFRTIRFTQAGCDQLSAYYGARATPRFIVIPPATEIPNLKLRPRPVGPIRLLSMGRLVPSKNVGFVIETLSTIIGPWSLDVVGDGPERSDLESLVCRQGLGHCVTFHGHVDNPSDFYRRADLLVAPSTLENAPLVIVEAMAHGVPTLTIRADGHRYVNANHELVRAGEDGFLASDEEDFGRQLSALVRSPAQLAEAGAQARVTAERRYSWMNHLDTYDSLLHSALDRSVRSAAEIPVVVTETDK